MRLDSGKPGAFIEEITMLLQEVQEPVQYHLKHLSPKAVAAMRAKKIPLLSRFMHDAGESGDAMMQLDQSIKSLHDGAGSMPGGFQFGAVSLAALDFLLIPAVYLGAYVLGEKVPVSLNNNARWAYATILLALAITALVVPVIAPIIALTSALLTFSLGTFLLGRSLYERYQLAKENRELASLINRAEQDMDALRFQAHELVKEGKLQNESTDGFSEYYYHSANILLEDYRSQKAYFIKLKEKQLITEQKIELLHITKVLDKSVGVAFAALSTAGLVLSFFMPPIGLSLLAITSIASLTYIVARLTAPLFKALGHWVATKLNTKPAERLGDQQSDHQVEKTLEKSSTASMLGDFQKEELMQGQALKNSQDNFPPPDDKPVCQPIATILSSLDEVEQEGASVEYIKH